MSPIKATLVLALFASSPLLAFAEDYAGSSFNEVLGVLTDPNPSLSTEVAKQEFSVYADGGLPHYAVNMSTMMSGSTSLERDAIRTVSERFDYYDRLAKKLHPNGVCLSGTWNITEPSPYTGFFKKGASGLMIGRASVAMGDTESGSKRGFGFAGKLFSTLDPNQKVETENFFSVDVLLGTPTPRFMDTAVTNEPSLGISFSPFVIRLGLFISNALSKADASPLFRPVTRIAKLGISENEKVSSPRWIRIHASSGQVKNDSLEFRTEVLQAVQDNGGNLKFDIEGSETTSDREAQSGWKKLGQIQMNQALVSYGCDRRLHFAHPKHDE